MKLLIFYLMILTVFAVVAIASFNYHSTGNEGMYITVISKKDNVFGYKLYTDKDIFYVDYLLYANIETNLQYKVMVKGYKVKLLGIYKKIVSYEEIKENK